MSYSAFRRSLILVALLFSAGDAIAQSQNPKTHSQNKSASDQRGTQDVPLYIKTQKSEEETRQEKEESARKISNDNWLWGFGLVQCFIFFAQLIVFKRQADRLQETVVEMQDAKGITKDATDAAIRAAIASEKLFATSEETAERQLRAYIGVDPLNFMGDNDIILKLTIRNTGQTPAYNIVIEAGSHEMTYNLNLPDGFTYPRNGMIDKMDRIGVLNPGIHHEIPCIVNRDTALKCVDRKIAWYFYGTIQYVDAFNKPRMSQFCYRYMPIINKETKRMSSHMVFLYKEHNEAT